MKIRIATLEDLSDIIKVGRETFYETWRPVNTEEDMQIYLDEAFSTDKIGKELKDSGTFTYFLCYKDNLPIGYAKLRRDRNYQEFDGTKAIELERIYVYNEYQQHKAGKALMDECIAFSIKEGNEWLWLGVNVDNHKAIPFYKKYGFTIFGEKNFKLGNAVDTDYLMKLKLK